MNPSDPASEPAPDGGPLPEANANVASPTGPPPADDRDDDQPGDIAYDGYQPL